MTPRAPVLFSLDDDGVGWIVFDDPAARANVFNPAVQAAFAAAVDAAAGSRARAVVIRSAKDRIFVAGADLRWVASFSDPAAATAFARTGQDILARVTKLGIPVVCAIHGACAGGGFELALACDWRLASDAPVTRIGLPETAIGTIPGWGGSARLPKLIGAQPALDHILRSQLIGAAEAARAGLVDELVPAGELKARAKQAALRLAAEGPPARPSPAAAPPAYFADMRAAALAKNPGYQPALLAAIDVVEQTIHLPIDEALRVEARIFGAVTTGDSCKNFVHVFFLKADAKKRSLEGWFDREKLSDATLPPPTRVGVVGAGVMGSGIAHWIAAHGIDVVLRDVDAGLLARGTEIIRGLFGDAGKRGKISAAAATAGLARIVTTTGWEGFDRCDLVIEAITEDVAAKQRLFTELAGVVRPDTVLASNTSALPIEDVAGHVPNPGRAIGLHFFNPVSRMPLVELVLARDTSAETAARMLAFVNSLGKSPVPCRSSPGFLITRVLFFYLNEAVRLWEQGHATTAIDAALRDFGWPMGPLRLIDEIGIDVTDFILAEMNRFFPERFARTTACAQLLAAGLKGRKNGASRGFYRYETGRESPNDAETRPLTDTPSPAARAADSPRVDLADRLMAVMIDEASRCLAEGVVKTADDVDFALLTGAGFPAFHGGLLRYARSRGKIGTV